jgi:ribose 5-phosphate isomerase B
MKIAIGTDHAGFELKQKMVKQVQGMGHQVLDMGTDSPESCDYPVFARKVGEAVSEGRADRGILICGNGIGMSIVANKIPGVRAALVYTEKMAEQTRSHNDSNVISLAGRDLPPETNLKLADIWLKTPFSGEERHSRRVREIREVEDAYMKKP